MTTTETATTASVIVKAVENAWNAIQANNADVPNVVVTFGAGIMARGLKLGHFAANVWTRGDDDVHELFIGAEGLARGAAAVMGTLLHEAAHAAAEARGIKDTSRQGRYHNTNFKGIAEAMGIIVEHSKELGWSTTTITDETQAVYEEAILELDASISAYRKGWDLFAPTTGTTGVTGGTIKTPAGRTTGRTSSNNGLSLQCSCGRKIRVSRTVAEMGGITCNVCGDDFE
jgi:hypothetical protein